MRLPSLGSPLFFGVPPFYVTFFGLFLATSCNGWIDQGWKGTVVVVSHNKDFVTRLSTTHTSIVEGGEVKFLDRPPRASDWEHDAEGQGWK